MKWTLPVLLVLMACGGREVTETTVSTSTTTPIGSTSTASGATAAGSGAAGGTLDGTGTTKPAIAGATTVLAADAVAYACLSDVQREQVGKPISDAVSVLPANARILRPDTLYTQDYLPNRINADVDGNEIVTRVWCG
ncbi:MAG: hypothetical protein AB3N11_01690 [Arenibacterium sp.]